MKHLHLKTTRGPAESLPTFSFRVVTWLTSAVGAQPPVVGMMASKVLFEEIFHFILHLLILAVLIHLSTRRPGVPLCLLGAQISSPLFKSLQVALRALVLRVTARKTLLFLSLASM